MDMPDLDELTDMPYLIPTMLFPSNIHKSGKSMRLFFTFTFIVMIMMVMMMMIMIVTVMTTMTEIVMTIMTVNMVIMMTKVSMLINSLIGWTNGHA